MLVKLKVDKSNFQKMIEGKEFNADFSSDSVRSLTEIYVYPEEIKEIKKDYVVVKEKSLAL